MKICTAGAVIVEASGPLSIPSMGPGDDDDDDDETPIGDPPDDDGGVDDDDEDEDEDDEDPMHLRRIAVAVSRGA